MRKDITSLSEFSQEISRNRIVLAYFGREECQTCVVLKPKVKELVTSKFPEIVLLDIDTSLAPEIYGQYTIFTVPSILLFLDGREILRRSRIISIKELEDSTNRIYNTL
ncbi:thioredoxin family protein [Alistipes sp. ZOR0009]|uniref:thioredoxin family protein n=1 Tax=Alistipes sp. ZOR0009 TaxID=1339253 RepID=UPI0006474356|nr:thioredoxin family protein [Alistipes sp. ZOR0009]